MVKPNFDDYMKAVIATQQGLIFCVLGAIFLLCYGLVVGSDGVLTLSALAVACSWIMWVRQYQPIERIKTKAVVISSRNQAKS